MGPIRSEQMCSRCRNHGISSILKGHKRSCKFLFCTCVRCDETKMRQKCIASEIAIHRKHLKMLKVSDSPKLKQICEKFDMKFQIDNGEHRRSQMCARCKNHGIDQQLRGHKNECQFAKCVCQICVITAKRRTIMAKQIRDYRQTKLIDETDVKSPETFDESSSSSSIEEDLPLLMPITNIQPVPHFFDKFYMVQSLYDKFLLQEPTKQIQLLYALVNLSGDDCTVLERALEEAYPYAREYTVHHQNFPPRSFFENFLPPSPAPSSSDNNLASKPNVRVRSIRELIENTSHSNLIQSIE